MPHETTLFRLLHRKPSVQHHQTVSIQDFVSEVLYGDSASLTDERDSAGHGEKEHRREKLRRYCGVFVKPASSRKALAGYDQYGATNPSSPVSQTQSHRSGETKPDSSTAGSPVIVEMPGLRTAPAESTILNATGQEDETPAPHTPSLQDFMREYAPSYSARHMYGNTPSSTARRKYISQLPTPPESPDSPTITAETSSVQSGFEEWHSDASWITTTSDSPEVSAQAPRLPSVVFVRSIGELRELRERLEEI